MAGLYSLPRLTDLYRSPRITLRGLSGGAGHRADSAVLEPQETEILLVLPSQETLRFLERAA